MLSRQRISWVWLSLCGLLTLVTGSPDEKRLTAHLLENYNRVGRQGTPSANSSEPFQVLINFGIIELSKFDIPAQELIMVGWTALEWEDEVLSWAAGDFSGVDQLSIDPSAIWTPDVILSNSLSGPQAIHAPNAHVTSEGHVTLVNSYVYHFYCKIPTEHMEWDNFPCSLKFVSWSLGSDKLLLKNKRERFDTNYYVRNREWEFFHNKAKTREISLPWGEGRRASEALYEFTLKRREVEEEEDLEGGAGPGASVSWAATIVLAVLLTQPLY